MGRYSNIAAIYWAIIFPIRFCSTLCCSAKHILPPSWNPQQTVLRMSGVKDCSVNCWTDWRAERVGKNHHMIIYSWKLAHFELEWHPKVSFDWVICHLKLGELVQLRTVWVLGQCWLVFRVFRTVSYWFCKNRPTLLIAPDMGGNFWSVFMALQIVYLSSTSRIWGIIHVRSTFGALKFNT